ncbi:MAG: hypothetical protein IJH37_12830 [Clostridia bacterium]|nr:hypothetical protein [Clostridia bacterium]
MKEYIKPTISISVFERTDIVSTSGGQTTAVDKARAVVNSIEKTAGTFTVDLW